MAGILLKKTIGILIEQEIADTHEAYDPGEISFRTTLGYEGHVLRNKSGDWDIWLGGDMVYQVEDSLYSLIIEESNNLFTMYERTKALSKDQRLKQRSRAYAQGMSIAIENILLDCPPQLIMMTGAAKIGQLEVIHKGNKHVVVNMN